MGQFLPFAVEVFGALGLGVQAAVNQYARVEGQLLQVDADYRRAGILQETSVALHSTNAKMLRIASSHSRDDACLLILHRR